MDADGVLRHRDLLALGSRRGRLAGVRLLARLSALALLLGLAIATLLTGLAIAGLTRLTVATGLLGLAVATLLGLPVATLLGLAVAARLLTAPVRSLPVGLLTGLTAVGVLTVWILPVAHAGQSIDTAGSPPEVPRGCGRSGTCLRAGGFARLGG
ncbi:hypothetical protein GCM10028815_18210 [Mariniluteicoccus flavus]